MKAGDIVREGFRPEKPGSAKRGQSLVAPGTQRNRYSRLRARCVCVLRFAFASASWPSRLIFIIYIYYSQSTSIFIFYSIYLNIFTYIEAYFNMLICIEMYLNISVHT